MENIDKNKKLGNKELSRYSTEQLDLLYSNSVTSGARNNPFSQEIKEEVKKRVSVKHGSKPNNGDETTTKDNNTEKTNK